MCEGTERARLTLAGHVAIVTGASSGIGAATACELGRRGAAVVLAARRADALEAQAEAIRAAGAEALPVPTDVTDPGQVAGSGVGVSLVCPGKIDTAMTSHVRARMPQPDLVARTIAKLVVNPRREVVIPRRDYLIAWLEQLLPAAADVTYRWRHWSPIE